MLFKDHVLCKECTTFKNNPDAGIVKIGAYLWSHKKHHHPAEYETITKGLNKITMKSNGEGVLPTSILNMPGFTVKVKVKDAKLLYRTATATLAIKEGIPFCVSLNLHSTNYLFLSMQNLTRLSTFLATMSEIQ